MPHRLESSFAKQSATEGNVLAVSPVYIFGETLEGRMVHKDPVYAIYVPMKEPDLQVHSHVRRHTVALQSRSPVKIGTTAVQL